MFKGGWGGGERERERGRGRRGKKIIGITGVFSCRYIRGDLFICYWGQGFESLRVAALYSKHLRVYCRRERKKIGRSGGYVVQACSIVLGSSMARPPDDLKRHQGQLCHSVKMPEIE